MEGTLARCCNPVPDEPIIGLITATRGIRIHRQDCSNILRVADRGRLLKISWGDNNHTYPVPIVIKAYDRPTLMRDILDVLHNINIAYLQSDPNASYNTRKHSLTYINMTLQVANLEELARVIERISKIQNVIDVYRVQGHREKTK